MRLRFLLIKIQKSVVTEFMSVRIQNRYSLLQWWSCIFLISLMCLIINIKIDKKRRSKKAKKVIAFLKWNLRHNKNDCKTNWEFKIQLDFTYGADHIYQKHMISFFALTHQINRLFLLSTFLTFYAIKKITVKRWYAIFHVS